jgi:uncharacterized delta-60 repeat protein
MADLILNNTSLIGVGTKQPDGKFLVADIYGKLSRYNADSSADLTFGVNGSVSFETITGALNNLVTALTLQADGKIVVSTGENSAALVGDSVINPSSLIRLNGDGTFDTAFNSKAQAASISAGNGATLLQVQTDGTIFYTRDNQLIKHASDGTLLSTQTLSNNSGLPGDRGGYESQFRFGVLQADNKIVIADYITLAGGTPPSAVTNQLILKRYNLDGTLDPSFGDYGRVRTLGDFRTTQVAIDSNGKILIAGTNNFETLLTRYNSNGTIDSSFGNQGILKTGLIDNYYNSYQNALFFPADGKILVSGKILVQSALGGISSGDPQLIRYNNDGSLDTSFGNGGKAIIDNAAHLLFSGENGSFQAIGTASQTPLRGLLTNYNSSGQEFATTFGGSGNNYLVGSGDLDLINGFAGNDTIYGEAGNDLINGGVGNDFLYGSGGNDFLSGGADGDNLYDESGNNTLDGGSGNDTVFAGSGNDLINGGDGDDIIGGGAGVNTLNGGAGNDIFGYLAGTNAIDGGSGLDVLYSEVDLASSTTNLIFNLNSFNFTGLSLSGIQSIVNVEAVRELKTGAGNDQISLDAADTLERIIQSGLGNDFVSTGAGFDYLVGGAGNDTLIGNAGADTIYGENGQDSIEGGDDADRLFGGNDDDLVNGGTGRDEISGGAGNDRLDGGGDQDNIWGEGGNDTIDGGAGNDYLWGNQGADLVLGGGGNDVLVSQEGNDTLTGGADRDAFVFGNGYQGFSELGLGTITDFSSGTDKILLTQAAFGATPLSFGVVATDGEVASSGSRIVFSQATNTLFYNANGVEAGLGIGGAFAKVNGLIGAADVDLTNTLY